MSLVPIIYTSLLIFSAFLLFVLTVSYISYKTKSGNRRPHHIRNIDPLGNRLALQPVPVNNYQVVRQTASQHLLPTQASIRPKHTESIQRTDDNYVRAVQVMQQKAYKTKIFIDAHEENNLEIKRSKESHQLTRSYQPIPISNRLRIMNQSEKFNTSIMDESYSIRKQNRYTNHGDTNLLSFYSDRSDMDYVAFSTPRISKVI